MIGFELGKETPTRQAPTKTRLLPNGLDPYPRAIEREINLVTRLHRARSGSGPSISVLPFTRRVARR